MVPLSRPSISPFWAQRAAHRYPSSFYHAGPSRIHSQGLTIAPQIGILAGATDPGGDSAPGPGAKMSWFQPQPNQYVEVAIRVPAPLQEAVEVELLDRGAMGTSATESDAPTLIVVVGYFSLELAPQRSQLESWLAGLASPLQRGSIAIETKPWKDWAAESRRGFRATSITQRLCIAPPWDIPDDPEGDLLIVEPGGAFGMGTHGTTLGCLELLEALPSSGSEAPRSALDVGTGTGVLSLRAEQLGIPRVIGFDNDPAAMAAALVNRGLNPWSRGIHLFAGDLGAISLAGTYDLVIANIILTPLLDFAPNLIASSNATGWMILSGFHEKDCNSILSRYASGGFSLAQQVVRDDWASLLLNR